MASAVSILLLLLLHHHHLSGAVSGGGGGHHHRTLEAACSATPHRSLCIHSLSSFSHDGSDGRSPRWWARAALSLAADEASRAAVGVSRLRHLAAGHLAASAFADCSECLADAVQQLRGSLAELRRLEPATFELQMGNVETWVSAALTNVDTCFDGLDTAGDSAALPAEMRRQILSTTYYTSNALALVNSLASAGGRM